MSQPSIRFSNAPWLAIWLGLLHALLAGSAVAIQLLDAWNDMNATMLVWVAFRWVDYPLWLLADALAPSNASITSHFVVVAILGTVAWMLVGLITQAIGRVITR